ncbi:MAG TPA: DUF1223 domain-containing protein [Blastocatellia bacterium]|nr:DUF1223 domain-containing protein [Blastocatellia bacterium]
MRLKIALVLIVPALTLVVVAFVGKRAAARYASAAQDRPPAAGAQRVPVLVELFTSEGCSSCPPADELLTRLEQTQPVDGAEVIALSEHVDYWNRLGWADPYSSSEFSARQNDYARAFDTDGVYTPQMIVDGRAQFVGSDSDRARKAIAGALRDSKATMTVNLASEDTRAGSITLDVRADRPQNVSEGDSAEVLLAITESGLRSSVSRGENAGRRLSHTAVIRKLTALGSVDSQGGAQFVAKPVVQISRGWKRESLKAVVFVQERTSRRVLGVAAISLGK